MQPITYSITPESDSAEQYYKDIARFTSDVIERASSLLPIIHRYTIYRNASPAETPRTNAEYFFDILCFGTLWRVYGNRALATLALPLFVLSGLYSLRCKYRSLKPPIDWLRGKLGAMWLTKPMRKRSNAQDEPLTTCEMRHFVLWLQATGEFPEEVKRLLLFIDFMKTLPLRDYYEGIAAIVAFCACFEKRSLEELGAYTAGVERFLNEELPAYKGREDEVFCGRSRVEYHLNMVGAELMNRAFRKTFEQTKKKALLVPACMRSNPATCKAWRDSLDMLCAHCDTTCAIHKLSKRGEVEGFDVHIIPHSSDFTRWLSTWAVGNNIGVIGVACPLNLIRGGLELKALDIPAQCVLLNECGCSSHWHKEGIPTSLDENELQRIMDSPRVEELPQRAQFNAGRCTCNHPALTPAEDDA